MQLGRGQKGIAAISTGTAAGQVITLLATPVLSRIYSPSDYGAFASLLAFVAIASTAGSLRLESAVPIASDSDALQLLKTCIVTSILAGLICAGLLAGLGHPAVSEGEWLAAGLEWGNRRRK